MGRARHARSASEPMAEVEGGQGGGKKGGREEVLQVRSGGAGIGLDVGFLEFPGRGLSFWILESSSGFWVLGFAF